MIIVVTGPTAVGKTKMSIELAKKYNAIIVNADSMQVYKKLDIGTAKITEKEKEGIPHYLFDIVEPTEMYTVFEYQRDLRKVLEEHQKENIIIVGGTGLYIKAGLYNYEFNEETTFTKYDDLSLEELVNKVKEKYPDQQFDFKNRKRLERALNKQDEYYLNGDELLYDAIFIGLTTDRKTLYEKINQRVDLMIENGLLDEVKSLYDAKINSKAINTGIGYKELYLYFDNKISLNEAITLIKQRSRHYAKRQYTWFKNKMDIKWFNTNYNDFNETIKLVDDYIKKSIQ